MTTTSGGPLAGLKVVELAGIGPVPFAGMVLADLGADVIRIDRVAAGPRPIPREFDVSARTRRSLGVDLRSERGREVIARLVAESEALMEGMRPGVAERLGLGPEDCHRVSPALVYGRMTGWGQSGPYAQLAGHDINYLSVTGGLHAVGHADRPPVPPLNMVGDYGGGAMYLAVGMLAALMRARTTGEGEVVDAAIVDGVGSLHAIMRGMIAQGTWVDRRESNLLDGGAPYYRAYRCADGKDIAIGAIEPQFWQELLDRIGLADDPGVAGREDVSRWPAIRGRLAEHFATRTRQEWVELTAGSDACLTPVLSFEESLADPHLVARGAFREVEAIAHPSPAPRFARAGEVSPARPPRGGEHTEEILDRLGYSAAEISAMRDDGVVA